jgi:hypothetical protein
MNASAPVSTVCVDPLAAFERQCAYWVGRYVTGRASLQRVTAVLEAMAPLDMPADEAQAIISDAITAAITAASDDDYVALTGSFARLCVEQDAKYRSSPDAQRNNQRRERVSALLNASTDDRVIVLTRPNHAAESITDAVEYLIREGDPARLDAFLAGRSAGQRVAIFREIERRNAARERAKKQKQREVAS